MGSKSTLFGAMAGLFSWTAAFAITSLFPLIGWGLLRRLDERVPAPARHADI